MKIISFSEGQNGKEWHAWRENGIGASDIPVLMGSNKFKTELQLWEEKCGLRQSDPMNPAIAHGIKNEEVARQWVNKNQQLNLEPICIEDIENPFFKASLDGYDSKNKVLTEIKCPVSVDILDNLRENQVVPLYWQHQIQWQIMLCKPERAFITVWDYRHENCVTVEAFAQPKLQKEMMDKAKEFWRMIQFGTPPKPSDKDYIVVEDPELKKLLEEYRDHDAVSKAAIERKKELKSKIVEFGDDGNFSSFGYFITRCAPRKSYDLDKMRMDGIDVDAYQKTNKSIGFYKISCPKD